MYQAKYASLALQSSLKTQLNKVRLNGIFCPALHSLQMQCVFDESFITNAIQLLNAAILNDALINPPTNELTDLSLAALLVNGLLGFLKGEHPYPTEGSINQRLMLSRTTAWRCFSSLLFQ